MPEVIWLPQALRDVERLYRFLHKTSPQAAQQAARIILAAAEPLQNFPELGLPVPDKPGYREIYARFGGGAYVIRYRINQVGTVLVVRVWHGKERGRTG